VAGYSFREINKKVTFIQSFRTNALPVPHPSSRVNPTISGVGRNSFLFVLTTRMHLPSEQLVGRSMLAEDQAYRGELFVPLFSSNKQLINRGAGKPPFAKHLCGAVASTTRIFAEFPQRGKCR
jgi:hypothetical protein